jgi:FkbM family methyltransferase
MNQTNYGNVQNGQDTPLVEAAEYIQIAMQLLRQGLRDKAEQHIAKAAILEPDNAQWPLELARLQRCYDKELARKSYETASQLGSANAQLEAIAMYIEDGSHEYLRPEEIWQADRLDVSIKLLLAKHILNTSDIEAEQINDIYNRHILQRTQGKEPESLGKTCLGDYHEQFRQLINSIRSEGFSDEFAIPIDANGRILNGAHRLAAALALQLDQVPVVRMPPSWNGLEWGMGWFLQNGFSPEEINLLLQQWIDAHPDQTGLLIVEHFGSGVPDQLMVDFYQQFKLLGWRDMFPSTPLSPALTPHPRGPWRYILAAGTPSDFKEFSARQMEKHGHRLNCHPVTGDLSNVWTKHLLDEQVLSNWHPEHKIPSDKSSLKAWTRFSCSAAESARALPPANFVKWRNLRLLDKVDTVIDVGVAYGTPDLYDALKPKHLIFIEPVSIFEEHIRNLQQQHPGSQYFPLGLSSSDEDSVINYRLDFPILTSLLQSSPLRDTGSEDIVELPVTLRRLDSVFSQFHHMDGSTLMKVDTEGFELEVLKGAVESIKRIKYLMLEISVIKRFEGSYNCSEIFAFLQSHGFILHTCLSASVDAEGFCRVIDAVFINTALSQQ